MDVGKNDCNASICHLFIYFRVKNAQHIRGYLTSVWQFKRLDKANEEVNEWYIFKTHMTNFDLVMVFWFGFR